MNEKLNALYREIEDMVLDLSEDESVPEEVIEGIINLYNLYSQNRNKS